MKKMKETPYTLYLINPANDPIFWNFLDKFLQNVKSLFFYVNVRMRDLR